MQISIIIPTYNADNYLPACLDSIFRQRYADYEVICIDDGSTDGTPATLRHYQDVHPNLHVIRQVNSGMATARNRALDVAKGEYILFVDSDDLLTDGALITLDKYLTGEDIVGFNAQKYHEADGSHTYKPSVCKCEKTTGWDYFNRHRLDPTDIHFVCVWQRAYRRHFLLENNLRFLDGLRRAEDDLFTTQVMLAAKTMRTITDCLYTYRIRMHSITHTIDPALESDSLHVHRLLEELFLPKEDIDKSAIYQVLASNYITRLTANSNIRLSVEEWRRFRQMCITPRHRRLYHLLRRSPTLYHIYNNLCSSLR